MRMKIQTGPPWPRGPAASSIAIKVPRVVALYKWRTVAWISTATTVWQCVAVFCGVLQTRLKCLESLRCTSGVCRGPERSQFTTHISFLIKTTIQKQWNNSPLSKNSGPAERKRPGRGEVNSENDRQKSPVNHIAWINLVLKNIMHWVPCSLSFAQPSYSHTHTLHKWWPRARPCCCMNQYCNHCVADLLQCVAVCCRRD